MKKEEKLEKCRKIKIQEKIDLKNVEMQADPCRNNQGFQCRYDCCRDCYNNTTPYKSPMA